MAKERIDKDEGQNRGQLAHPTGFPYYLILRMGHLPFRVLPYSIAIFIPRLAYQGICSFSL
jgi:hypothetical protein